MSKKYKVIGFNRKIDKPPGKATRFKEEHCYFTDKLPTEDELREYAMTLGYYPSKPSRGEGATKCKAVYYYV